MVQGVQPATVHIGHLESKQKECLFLLKVVSKEESRQ